MNKIAAIPLTITTGEYWLIESSTAGDCLAKTGARKSKFPGHRDSTRQQPSRPSRTISTDVPAGQRHPPCPRLPRPANLILALNR
jgi:hypothetical protein